VIYKLNEASDYDQYPWTVDISKKYINKHDQVRYAWRFIFQGENLKEHYAQICSIIRSAPQPSRVELQSIILPGHKPGDIRGGVNAKGKGSSRAGSAPMAVTRRMT
jgi:hypothetical protein